MKFQVEWYDRLASTNLEMRDRFYNAHTVRTGLVIAAHEQTAGRGRQDRKWISCNGKNLCFSMFLQTDRDIETVPSLTMATALAVNDLLRGRGILSSPKWPNDVMVDGKKICGILSERVACNESATDTGAVPMTGIIVGVGLNVNMTTDEAALIDRPATSVLIETDQAGDLSELLESLFEPLNYWLTEWDKGGFPILREAWTEKAGPIGRSMTVHDGDVRKSGSLAGFGPHGELLLQTGSGIETIWSGDVS